MDDELSDRERAIAKEAAKLAVTELANELFRQVGESGLLKFVPPPDALSSGVTRP